MSNFILELQALTTKAKREITHYTQTRVLEAVKDVLRCEAGKGREFMDIDECVRIAARKVEIDPFCVDQSTLRQCLRIEGLKIDPGSRFIFWKK